jgi:hypothetical protein
VASTYLLYSGDGINWAQSSYTLGGGPVEWNGSYFVCGGPGPEITLNTTTTNISLSTDGINWNMQTIGNYGIVKGIAWNGNIWVLTTNSNSTVGIITSYNGSTWTGVGSIPSGYTYTGIEWNGLTFIINTTGNTILTSYDGINWNTTTLSQQNGVGITWTNPNIGNMNIIQPTIVGGSGTFNTMAYSLDGINYRNLGNNIFTTSCNSVAWNGNIWVAGGRGNINTLAYSYDGLLWTGIGMQIFSSACYKLLWNGKMWLACGAGNVNTLATSVDGKTWIGLGKTTFTTACNSVLWMSNMWVAGGTGGNVLAYSTNTNIWTQSSSTIFSSTNSIYWNGSIAVAVGTGTGNTIATSTDGGITWTGSGTSIFTISGNGISWNTKRWIAVGSGENTIANSSNGLVWYGAYNNNTIFANGTGLSVGTNSKLGPVVVNSSIYFNTNDRLVINGPNYYDGSIANNTSISFNLNLPI